MLRVGPQIASVSSNDRLSRTRVARFSQVSVTLNLLYSPMFNPFFSSLYLYYCERKQKVQKDLTHDSPIDRPQTTDRNFSHLSWQQWTKTWYPCFLTCRNRRTDWVALFLSVTAEIYIISKRFHQSIETFTEILEDWKSQWLATFVASSLITLTSFIAINSLIYPPCMFLLQTYYISQSQLVYSQFS